jgi:hypothetical protein
VRFLSYCLRVPDSLSFLWQGGHRKPGHLRLRGQRGAGLPVLQAALSGRQDHCF